MLRGKGGLGTLLLAGAAAFAYYKYSKMSDEQKRNLANTIKEKGRKFYDENIPENVKGMFKKTQGQHAGDGTMNA